MAAPTRRLTLEFSEETYQMLQKLAKDNHKSMIDVVREGIALRSFAEEQKQQGKSLSVTKDDKIETKIILA